MAGSPHDFPPKSTVYDWFRKWNQAQDDGVCAIEKAHRLLAQRMRRVAGKAPKPSRLIVDGQCAQNTSSARKGGYHGGKKINGILRLAIVDTLGVLHGWHAAPANQSEHRAAIAALAAPGVPIARLEQVVADSLYRGERFAQRVFDLTEADVLITPRNSHAFKLQPIRWIVETFFGWLGHCHRLDKNRENTLKSAQDMMVFASLLRMVRAL